MDVNKLNANNPLGHRLNEAETQQTRDVGTRSAGADGTGETPPARQGDEVSLSSQARQLQDIENEAVEQDAFDETRVNEIKAAIAEGRYHVDPQRLAERFFQLETQLDQ